MEAMFFPASISQAKEEHDNVPQSFMISNGENTIHFTRTFKYLGSLINMALNEDDKILHRIRNTWNQMGMMRQLLKCRDICMEVKYWAYVAGPLNTILWGSESWNLTKTSRNKLNVFHHSAIHYILGVRMKRVQEEEKIQQRQQKDLSQHPNN